MTRFATVRRHYFTISYFFTISYYSAVSQPKNAEMCRRLPRLALAVFGSPVTQETLLAVIGIGKIN